MRRRPPSHIPRYHKRVLLLGLVHHRDRPAPAVAPPTDVEPAVRQQAIDDALHERGAWVVGGQHASAKLTHRLLVQLVGGGGLLGVADDVEAQPARDGHALEVVGVGTADGEGEPAGLVRERRALPPGAQGGEKWGCGSRAGAAEGLVLVLRAARVGARGAEVDVGGMAEEAGGVRGAWCAWKEACEHDGCDKHVSASKVGTMLGGGGRVSGCVQLLSCSCSHYVALRGS